LGVVTYGPKSATLRKIHDETQLPLCRFLKTSLLQIEAPPVILKNVLHSSIQFLQRQEDKVGFTMSGDVVKNLLCNPVDDGFEAFGISPFNSYLLFGCVNRSSQTFFGTRKELQGAQIVQDRWPRILLYSSTFIDDYLDRREEGIERFGRSWRGLSDLINLILHFEPNSCQASSDGIIKISAAILFLPSY